MIAKVTSAAKAFGWGGLYGTAEAVPLQIGAASNSMAEPSFFNPYFSKELVKFWVTLMRMTPKKVEILYPATEAEYKEAARLLAEGRAASGEDDAGFGLILQPCLRPAIPEIEAAAKQLQRAVRAHIAGDAAQAQELIRETNTDTIREWVESIWGKKSRYVHVRLREDASLLLSESERVKERMPSEGLKQHLLKRDGFRCRFCGIPVIRCEVRKKLHSLYPEALPWGRSNNSQHAAFQAMWAQFDHLVPHARGGKNEEDNLVVTCGPCNFGRMGHTLEEVGLSDPRARQPIQSGWVGLEEVVQA